MATEEPAYTLVREGPDFELRRYAPQLLAETEVSGDFDDVGGDAFRRLADYIFGNNQAAEKIAMTAPVSQAPVAPEAKGGGTRIPMTAPVKQQADDAATGTYRISFVMPSRFTLETIPRPTDPRIELRQEPERLMAVLRYSGGWGESRYRAHERKLLEAVRAAGLTPIGTPVYARYNSPFSLPFLRRNEVMVEIK
ncbi:SOUL family heme-binding protein [Thiorhodovibrio frisius]|uniref:SOUL heme-binding protein n=1 Tax=Thiorhodovibrio frisius TaxID=631362 RepID=H8YW26_9GAMM|nr:heme-binding protein [Thiorhodovibrio frisius]EIC23817.1 SOUL heme-binding protein [Thiorhodovibrio frisius]WPL22998.1 SOUL heme-binding protein [Thiorhodovibrio frisius]